MSVASAKEVILRYQRVAVWKIFKKIKFFLELKNKICGIVNAVIRNVIKNLFQIILGLLR